jgi:integrase/recombinase XerD
MTRSGVRQRLLVAQQRAIKYCPSLSARKITPHTLRHTTAMHLLQSGVDLSLIALWLGHEQIDTTHQYMEANLDMKRVALESLKPIDTGVAKRFKKPSDAILAFFESLLLCKVNILLCSSLPISGIAILHKNKTYEHNTENNIILS